MEILKEDLVHLNKNKSYMKQNMLTTKLINIREYYDELHETVNLMNETIAYSLLIMIIVMVAGFAILTFWLVLGMLKNTQVITVIRK